MPKTDYCSAYIYKEDKAFLFITENEFQKVKELRLCSIPTLIKERLPYLTALYSIEQLAYSQKNKIHGKRKHSKLVPFTLTKEMDAGLAGVVYIPLCNNGILALKWSTSMVTKQFCRYSTRAKTCNCPTPI